MGQLTVATLLPSSGLQNRIINGAMNVDQINEGAAYTQSADGTYQTLDCMSMVIQTAAGNCIFQQQTLASWSSVITNSGGMTPNGRVLSVSASASAQKFRLLHTVESNLLDVFGLSPGVNTGNGMSKDALLSMKFIGPASWITNARGMRIGVPITVKFGNRQYSTLASFTIGDTSNGNINYGYLVTAIIPFSKMQPNVAWWQPTNLDIYVDFGTVGGATLNAWVPISATDVASGGGLSTLFLIGGFAITDLNLQLAYQPVLDWKNPFSQDLRLCQRYYEKSFDNGVAVAQAAGNSRGAASYMVPVAGINNAGINIPFKVPKLSIPTMTAYNPINVNANWRNVSLGTDSGAASFVNIGQNGCGILNPQVAGDVVGNTNAVHWTANARLS